MRYTGVDLSPAMIALAKERRPDLDVRVANILEEDLGEFDVVMANGIFYLLGEDAEALMRRLVERMWAHAGRALAFNSLSAWGPDPEPGEFYADPAATLAWTRELTPYLALRHDYHTRDFTIYAYRDRRGRGAGGRHGPRQPLLGGGGGARRAGPLPGLRRARAVRARRHPLGAVHGRARRRRRADRRLPLRGRGEHGARPSRSSTTAAPSRTSRS